MYACIIEGRLVITKKRIYKSYVRNGKQWYEYVSCILVNDDQELIISGKEYIDSYLSEGKVLDIPTTRSKMGPEMRDYSPLERIQYSYYSILSLF